MTTQTRGPSAAQMNALRAQARAAGLSEAEWAAKAGGTALETLSHDQVDKLFALAKGGGRDLTTGASGGSTGGALVVPANIFPAGTLLKVIERYGVAGGEAAFRAWIAPEPRKPEDRLTDDEILLGLQILEARGLSVVKKQGYLAKATGKLVVIPAIDGLRAIAARTGQYAGSDAPIWYDADERPHKFWNPTNPDDHPAACEVTVYRLVQGVRQPTTELVTWRSFANTANKVWVERDDHMIAIVAERHALRKAFPEETEGLNDEPPTEDELERAAQGAFFAWVQAEGLTHEQALAVMGEGGTSLREAAMLAGGWRELWRRANQRAVGRPEARAALGEATTLRLREGDNSDAFWTEAVRARMGEADVLAALLVPDRQAFDALATKVGWPELTLRLRAHVAKVKRDAAVERSMPAGYVHDPRAVEGLYPSDPAAEAKPRPEGDEPRGGPTAPNTPNGSAQQAAQGEQAPNSAPEPGGETGGSAAAGSGHAEQAGANDAGRDNDDASPCPLCGERPAEVDGPDGIALCGPCYADAMARSGEADDIRQLPAMPDDVDTLEAFLVAIGNEGYSRADLVRAGKLPAKGAPAEEWQRAWNLIVRQPAQADLGLGA